ncbi:alpha-glucan phosphorylase, partial [mine drainage metagenome]
HDLAGVHRANHLPRDYDLQLARSLVSGVDVWLNTPIAPLEASGTSGIKAAINGRLNLSILDGWWAEGCMTDNGWGIPPPMSRTGAGGIRSRRS